MAQAAQSAAAEPTTTTTTSVAAAAVASGSGPRKRVKVYELKNNDWYDRGTGFCSGALVDSPNSGPDNPDGRVVVVSEEDPSRTLLSTQITKDDGYQKQQDTLIVWTENDGVDMALSFQEAEGCAHIWDFVSDVQGRLAALAPDDGLSDDLLDPIAPVVLPEPQLGCLEEVEAYIRNASMSPDGRDALTKFIMHPDQMYILRLAPLVAMAEEKESVQDLHRLCTIMKLLVLLNDTAIIEFIVTDDAIMGVVGALEYDPDFPSHRANHRQYLSDSSRFKEVVPLENPDIRRKIHWTYRLLYLKDVVLARILDDPTFSVLNGLIFFHQVDIINHVQDNPRFLGELFHLFSAEQKASEERKKDGVLFIQNCCAVSRNIQVQNRAQLYTEFINHGLFAVITFALRHHDAAVRVAGTDILVALIDHDAQLVRNHIFDAIREKRVPITDTLIELLLVEVDLGVKSQMADAIKVLLDPTSGHPGMDMMTRVGPNADMMAKQRGGILPSQPPANAQTSQFIDSFYESSAKRLFAPLKKLVDRPSMTNLTVQEMSLFTHLVEVLCFFVRQHSFKSKLFILSENLHGRVAQLFACPQKHMKLMALKWFRTCVGLGDEFHNRQMIQQQLFAPILAIVEATMPRDNLLNSACLELFEYIRREGVKQILYHLVEAYRDRLMAITYVGTFKNLVLHYEQAHSGYHPNGMEDTSLTTSEGTPHRMMNGTQSFAGLRDMDNDEEAYFNADDDADDDDGLPTRAVKPAVVNGASPVRPSLVNYPDDDEEEPHLPASSPDPLREQKVNSSDSEALGGSSDASKAEPMDEDTTSPTGPSEEVERGRRRTASLVQTRLNWTQSPLESLAIKRRRDDSDDDDELGKLMGGAKRRNSSVSLHGTSSSQPDVAAAPPDGESAPRSIKGHCNDTNNKAPTLRCKDTLKPAKETALSDRKLAMKPISVAPAVQQHSPPPDETLAERVEDGIGTTDQGEEGRTAGVQER